MYYQRLDFEKVKYIGIIYYYCKVNNERHTCIQK